MRLSTYAGTVALALLIMIVTAGCGSEENGESTSPSARSPAIETVSNREEGPCKAIPDWVDFLRINDIMYSRYGETTEPASQAQLGEKVGEVSYMLNDHACTDHVSQNGDAAYLPIGTEICSIEGYKPEFRVSANGRIYQVNDNPHAETMGDLLDIEGKVEKIGLENGNDGSPIGDFRPEATTELIKELLPLQHVGFKRLYESIKHEAVVFLRIYLKDGMSFRIAYYPKSNAFSGGAFATEELGWLVMSERARIKAEAGL